MKLIRSPGIAPLILGAAAALGAGYALSQPYPARPIRVVVPSPAGGLVDAAARVAGERVPLIAGSEAGVERSVISEYSSEGVCAASRMLRQGRYKYLFTCGLPPLLFDLEDDPDELKNLAGTAAGFWPRWQAAPISMATGLISPLSMNRSDSFAARARPGRPA